MACSKFTCRACASPESGRLNAARRPVAWRCRKCEAREVQRFDFAGEAIWDSVKELLKNGVKGMDLPAHVAQQFTVAQLVQAICARASVEVRLPDVVNPPSVQYDKEMRWLAAFAEAERVECLKTDTGDSFVLTKRGRKLVIHARVHGRDDARLDVEDPGPL